MDSSDKQPEIDPVLARLEAEVAAESAPAPIEDAADATSAQVAPEVKAGVSAAEAMISLLESRGMIETGSTPTGGRGFRHSTKRDLGAVVKPDGKTVLRAGRQVIPGVSSPEQAASVLDAWINVPDPHLLAAERLDHDVQQQIKDLEDRFGL